MPSPVSIASFMPLSFKNFTASPLVGFTPSITANSASALLSSARYITVLPCADNSSARASISFETRIPPNIARLPNTYRLPLYSAVAPLPTTYSKFSTAALSPQYSHMHFASGWLELLSIPAASALTFTPPSSNTKKSETLGFPSVIVAVLSNSTQFISRILCNASASLYSTPSEAPLPVAVIIATGVASPSAHGQDTTSTEIAYVTQCSGTKAPSINIHTTKVMSAIAVTVGTNMPATLSANF